MLTKICLQSYTFSATFPNIFLKKFSKTGNFPIFALMLFLDLIYQSMQDSAQQVRRSLGRPSSRATRQQALQQVAMLKAAKEAVK
jgi:hypothetical protein